MPYQRPFYTTMNSFLNQVALATDKYRGGALVTLVTLLFVFLFLPQNAFATIDLNFTDNFDSYAIGSDLIGNGGWVNDGTRGCCDTATSTIQVSSIGGGAVTQTGTVWYGRQKQVFSSGAFSGVASTTMNWMFKYTDSDGSWSSTPGPYEFHIRNAAGDSLCVGGMEDQELFADAYGSSNRRTMDYDQATYDNVWTAIEIDLDFSGYRCRLTANGTTTAWSSWGTLVDKTPVDLWLNMDGVDSTGYAQIDYFAFGGFLPGESVPQVDTTQIIDTDPGLGELVSTSTDIFAETQYYVQSEHSGGLFGTTYFEYTLQHINSDGSFDDPFVVTKEVTQFDQVVSNFDFISQVVTEPGTYTVGARIYIDNVGGVLGGFCIACDYDVSPFFATTFYVATRTVPNLDNLDRDKGIIESAYGSITCEIDFLSGIGLDDFTCMGEYLIATIIPNDLTVLTDKFKSTLNAFFLIPPWGYVSYLHISLLNPATTTPQMVEISFPVDSPASGLTATLDPSLGITMVQERLSGASPSYDGTYYEQMMFYWGWFWRIVLAFWLLTNILGVFSLERTSDLKEKGVQGIRDVNMRKPRSGTINVRRG